MEAKTNADASGVDLATVCRGLLLRVGLAASATAVMLGLLAADVIPRLKNIDYLKAGLHVDSAVTLAPLLLLATISLCAVPLVGPGRNGILDRLLVFGAVISVILFAVGLVNMFVEKTLTPLLCVSAFLFCLTVVHALIEVVRAVLAWVGHDGSADPARLTFIWGIIVFLVGVLPR